MIKVLDHGEITLTNVMGDDLSVVNAARVSHQKHVDHLTPADVKLIHYLMKNKHTTPFEQVQFTFRVKAPIFVFRQWHRHRTWSYNEVSARYTQLPEEYYVPDPQLVGGEDPDNKQGRVFKAVHVTEDYDIVCSDAHDTYRELLKRGWPKELARGVLPVATYSEMVASVDLHNLFHFLTLRMHEHAQYEIRVYAEALLKLIEPIVPHCVEAWKVKQPGAVGDC